MTFALSDCRKFLWHKDLRLGGRAPAKILFGNSACAIVKYFYIAVHIMNVHRI